MQTGCGCCETGSTSDTAFRDYELLIDAGASGSYFNRPILHLDTEFHTNSFLLSTARSPGLVSLSLAV